MLRTFLTLALFLSLTLSLKAEELVVLDPQFQGVWHLEAMADAGEELEWQRVSNAARATGTQLIIRGQNPINFERIVRQKNDNGNEENLVLLSTGRVMAVVPVPNEPHMHFVYLYKGGKLTSVWVVNRR